jgi:hypothetical protein
LSPILPASLDPESWQPLAWRLWRAGYEPSWISRHLVLNGRLVAPRVVEEYVTARAGRAANLWLDAREADRADAARRDMA